MKLLTIEHDGEYALGIVTDRGILDVSAALAATGNDGLVPETVHDVIEGGAEYVRRMAEWERKLPNGSYYREETSVSYGPCVTNPSKIICVGLNYRKHAEESNMPIPEFPILFNKFNNTLTGHGHDVPLPRVTEEADYEAELTIVIGKTAKYVSKEEALDRVFGYCCANDLSARDLQFRTNQWLLGKSLDSFSPLGPYLVTADEVGDPNALDIKCMVNGEERQHSHTSDMIFPCDEIVSYISQHMTLFPGDIILTGTPAGVALGYPPDSRPYLKHGDIVTIEIEKLGAITNRMVAE